jgi:hypothetical protein
MQARQLIGVAAMCLALLARPSDVAQGGEMKSAADLTGLWAHSESDCQLKMSGELDQKVGRMTMATYGMIGFCEKGMKFNMIAQPVTCEAEEVKKEAEGFRYSARCQVKDYDPIGAKFRVKASGPDAISFDKSDFDENKYFWIDGDYVRCTRKYSCPSD